MKSFELFVIVALLIVLTTVRAKSFRKYVIHVPVKVRHHHHTHTVLKHVHHTVPVHIDHHVVDHHVVHPEIHEDYDDDWSEARTLGSVYHPEDEDDYGSFQRFMRKRSKSKQKNFTNKSIGWNGRSGFDKIAAEYKKSLKRHKTPDHDYEDNFAPFEDDDSKKKRK